MAALSHPLRAFGGNEPGSVALRRPDWAWLQRQKPEQECRERKVSIEQERDGEGSRGHGEREPATHLTLGRVDSDLWIVARVAEARGAALLADQPARGGGGGTLETGHKLGSSGLSAVGVERARIAQVGALICLVEPRLARRADRARLAAAWFKRAKGEVKGEHLAWLAALHVVIENPCHRVHHMMPCRTALQHVHPVLCNPRPLVKHHECSSSTRRSGRARQARWCADSARGCRHRTDPLRGRAGSVAEEGGRGGQLEHGSDGTRGGAGMDVDENGVREHQTLDLRVDAFKLDQGRPKQRGGASAGVPGRERGVERDAEGRLAALEPHQRRAHNVDGGVRERAGFGARVDAQDRGRVALDRLVVEVLLRDPDLELQAAERRRWRANHERLSAALHTPDALHATHSPCTERVNPTTHAHSQLPGSDHEFRGHGAHVSTASASRITLYVPASHSVHAPSSVLANPALHRHVVAASALPRTEWLCAGHALHAPPSGPKKPALHTQLPTFWLRAGESLWSGHAMHEDEATDPW
eukprot:2227249-Rhodomonas_salina.2